MDDKTRVRVPFVDAGGEDCRPCFGVVAPGVQERVVAVTGRRDGLGAFGGLAGHGGEFADGVVVGAAEGATPLLLEVFEFTEDIVQDGVEGPAFFSVPLGKVPGLVPRPNQVFVLLAASGNCRSNCRSTVSRCREATWNFR